MKIVILGGVAAGTKAAAKIKRENRAAEVELYTKSSDISYAGCGLPYYVGGDIETREELVVNTPAKFTALTGVTVFTGQEAVAVYPQKKTVEVRSVADGGLQRVSYDKLVLATGAAPLVPPIEGVNLQGVFTVRTPDDAVAIREYIRQNGSRRAVVVGAGFIGMEMAENLMAQKLSVTLLDMGSQILPGVLDSEMAGYAAKHLRQMGMKILTGTALASIQGEQQVTAVKTAAAGELPADVVVLAIGVRPATEFLKESGIELEKGAVVVDEYQQTNLPDIYAAGDCAVVKNRVTGNLCGGGLCRSEKSCDRKSSVVGNGFDGKSDRTLPCQDADRDRYTVSGLSWYWCSEVGVGFERRTYWFVGDTGERGWF